MALTCFSAILVIRKRFLFFRRTKSLYEWMNECMMMNCIHFKIKKYQISFYQFNNGVIRRQIIHPKLFRKQLNLICTKGQYLPNWENFNISLFRNLILQYSGETMDTHEYKKPTCIHLVPRSRFRTM